MKVEAVVANSLCTACPGHCAKCTLPELCTDCATKYNAAPAAFYYDAAVLSDRELVSGDCVCSASRVEIIVGGVK